MRAIQLGCFIVLGLLAAAHVPLGAQQLQRLEIIRGRVTGPDSQPVSGASVVVRRANSRETRATTTNESGVYTVLFPGAAGDYIVSARFILMAPAMVRVTRAGNERVLTANLTLVPADDAKLAPVTVTARKRPRPQRSGGTPSVDDGPTGGENDPRQPWDDSEAAFDPRSFSVLGTDPSENSLTVNGAEVQTILPNAVGMGGRMSTGSADASVGGFSGGRLAAAIGSAEQYHLRYLSAWVAPAAFTWVDRPSADAGARSSRLAATLWTADPLFGQRAHLTSVLTYTRSSTPLPEFPTTPAGLARLGLAPDSLARFLDLMSRSGIPATAPTMPNDYRSTRLAWMGHLSIGDAGAKTNVSLDANLGTAGVGGAFTSPSALPSYGGQMRATGGFVTAALSQYIGNNFLIDLSTTFNVYTSRTSPYLSLPEGRVRVFSALSSGDSALTWLSFGGNPNAGRSRTATWQARGSTTWLSYDGKQRHHVGGELHTEQLWSDPATGDRGAFEFESLEALAAGAPSRFTRRTPAAAHHGSSIRGALFLDNRWAVRPKLTVQYGLRLDVGNVDAATAYNAAVDSVFGRRTDALPHLASVSPRLGVSWEWDRPFDEHHPYQPTAGSLALIVGRYQSYLDAGTGLAAAQGTGLPSTARILDCAGDAVPVPDWQRFEQDPTSIPGTCTDGSVGAPTTSYVPSVALLDRYRPPAQWRAEVLWHNLTWTEVYVTLTQSRGTQQRSAIDLNLQPVPQFALADEADRPVYAPVSDIVPSTGAAALGTSRRSSLFGPVIAAVSDLHTAVTQLTVGKPFLKGHRVNFYAQYIYQTGREQLRGFGGLTAGDPFAAAWGRAALRRHSLNLYTTANISHWARLIARTTLESGLPYTPIVEGDVNGDGTNNDIAFIPWPSSPLGDAMAATLRGAPAGARHCLARQAGRIAARNSCTGPWSGTLDLRLELSPPWLPPETGIFLDVANAVGGLDRLLHGTAHAHGWGDESYADPRLLVATGFDPATRRFNYQVNPRFGQRPGGTAWHRPVELRLSVRMPIGPSLTTQQNRALASRARAIRDDPGATTHAVLPVGNPFAEILRVSEKLRLGPDQTDSLRAMQQRWRTAIDSTQEALAAYLAQLDASVADREIVRRIKEAAARIEAATTVWLPAIRGLLTESQLERLPRSLQLLLAGGVGSGAAATEP